MPVLASTTASQAPRPGRGQAREGWSTAVPRPRLRRCERQRAVRLPRPRRRLGRSVRRQARQGWSTAVPRPRPGWRGRRQAVRLPSPRPRQRRSERRQPQEGWSTAVPRQRPRRCGRRRAVRLPCPGRRPGRCERRQARRGPPAGDAPSSTTVGLDLRAARCQRRGSPPQFPTNVASTTATRCNESRLTRSSGPRAVAVAEAYAEAGQPTRLPARHRSPSPGRASRPGSLLAFLPATRPNPRLGRRRCPRRPTWLARPAGPGVVALATSPPAVARALDG